MTSELTSTIVAVANAAHLPHVRALFAGARSRGGWRGDMVLIANPDIAADDITHLRSRGIHVFRGKKHSHPTFGKFHMLEPFFQRWNRLVYLDTDVMVCRSMAPLLDLEGPAFCDPESYLAREHFSLTHPRLYEAVCGLLPGDAQAFNAGAMILDPSRLKNRITLPWAQYLRRKFRPLNRRWDGRREGDQPIFNLLLAGLWKPFPQGEIMHWDTPMREKTCALHFCHWRAPWKEWKNLRHSDFFGREYRAVYQDDLGSFDQYFPPAQPGHFWDANLSGALRRVLRRRFRAGIEDGQQLP